MTTTAAPAPSLVGSKAAVPIVRPGLVRRNRVIRRLGEAADCRVVSVTAPGGYGKTTVLAQWVEEDPRPCAWLTVDERDNDPVLLVSYVRAALERAGILEPPAPAALRRDTTSPRPTLVPDLLASLAEAGGAFVLVVDDVHLLTAGEAIDVLAAVVREISAPSQLVLAGRREPTPLVARRRALGDVLDLGPTELALTDSEGDALLTELGVQLADGETRALTRHVEGWPAGLYLTALAVRAGGAASTPPGGGIDRFLEDYLWAEHLAHVAPDQLDFLARSSVLDRMRPDLCDAVLGRHDSRRMLEAIEASNLFLVPLDHERSWFRYHDLFRTALQREHERTDASAADELRRRAAEWCEAHGLLEDAMGYALASSDTEQTARLFVALAFPLYRAGRMATVAGWLDRFDTPALVDRHPDVAVLGTWFHALRGNVFQAERWQDAAGRAAAGAARALADGSTARAWVATASAVLCRNGPARMREDAALALAELGPFSPFRAPAMWLRATASLLAGERAQAEAQLEDAAGAAEATGATFAGSTALAQRALLALGAGDVPAARAFVSRAHALVGREAFADYVPMAILLVADARTSIAEGDSARAEQALARAQPLRPYLTAAIPFYAVQTLAEMARAYLALDDLNGCRAVLVDAVAVLRQRPELGILVQDVEGLRTRAAEVGQADSGWESSLTAAELRLLPLLTTHLTFREIGDRLYVSRNTVKTQAISIYRKLGVSSRGEAVQRAAELGLVLAPGGITPSG